MEELTIEQKAKRYDEVSKEVKDFFEGRRKMQSDVTQTLEYLFPELEESDDERIRKKLLKMLNDMERDESILDDYGLDKLKTIAWLKGLKDRIQSKQSNKPQGKLAFEAIKEEKVDNANKVEPKFHEGDWVVRKDGKKLFKDIRFAQIIKINKTISQPMYLVDCENWIYEDEIRLWTLADAKNGDVLVSSDNKPFIFNGWIDEFNVGAHCGLNIYNEFTIADKLCNWTENRNIKPATKKERQTLFKEINLLGWVWYPETKELNRLDKNNENNS